MTIYLMTLHQCDGTTAPIGAGASYVSLDAARAAAIQLARTIMTDEIRRGRLCLSCWIVIKNQAGHSMMTVPFGEAITLLDHPTCAGPAATAPDEPARTAAAAARRR